MSNKTEFKKPNFVHWKLGNSGSPIVLNTADNLRELVKYRGLRLCFNQMTYEPEIDDLETKQIVQSSYTQIESMLISDCNIFGLPQKAVSNHLLAISESEPYHPIKEWLNDGKWDGIKRVDEVILCLPVKHIELSLNVLKHWLVGCVASLYESNFKSKLVPVLQGEQSYRKTAFIERIAKITANSFLEGAELNPDSKDSVLSCIRAFIVELGELERTSKNSQGSLKAFITKEIDTVRPPYAKTDIKKVRQSHFIATVNGNDFLKDDTGSSRFVALEMIAPANMDKLNSLLGWSYNGTGKIEQKAPELLHQFWLEIKALYEAGFGWMLSDDIIIKAKEVNESFRDKGNWYQYIRETYVDSSSTKVKRWVSAADLVNLDSNLSGVNTKQIGIALSHLHKDSLIDRKVGRSRSCVYLLKI
ncbi:hypothetical protein AYY22_07840 [Photobacterium kishitanii]|nr:hypothetical protein AYY22_07840 [Photobacterium kishitanii]